MHSFWRRFSLCLVSAALFCAGCVTPPASRVATEPAAPGALFVYASFRDQVTGIAVSKGGRMFVNFPRWLADPFVSVAELLPGGDLRPFPDADWNLWGQEEMRHPEDHFVCVQSVYIDTNDMLWILDPASPGFKGVVSGGAKLLGIDLATGFIEHRIIFDAAAAPPKSYLNDVRVSPDRSTAYLTDSGLGAILVVDLESGKTRRVLEDHPATKAEPGYVPVIDGKELRDQSGQPPAIHADGLALDTRGEYLYFHALTGRTLYRISTRSLLDEHLPAAELAARVEKVADTGAVDGMFMDLADNLYLTALEQNAIQMRAPNGTIDTVIKDQDIHWPDSLALGPDRYLYFTASQIGQMPRFNGGTDRRSGSYKLFRVWVAPLGGAR